MTEVGDGPIVLCFYCKSGKHRSVALAALMYFLAHSFPRMNTPKFEKVRLWHAMRGYWDAPSCCNECVECSMDRLLLSPVVNEALTRVDLPTDVPTYAAAADIKKNVFFFTSVRCPAS